MAKEEERIEVKPKSPDNYVGRPKNRTQRRQTRAYHKRDSLGCLTHGSLSFRDE